MVRVLVFTIGLAIGCYMVYVTGKKKEKSIHEEFVSLIPSMSDSELRYHYNDLWMDGNCGTSNEYTYKKLKAVVDELARRGVECWEGEE